MVLGMIFGSLNCLPLALTAVIQGKSGQYRRITSRSGALSKDNSRKGNSEATRRVNDQ
jgi:hypothetical protein